MAVQAHIHDWTQTNGGFQCLNCSAFFSPNLMHTNLTDPHHSTTDFNTVLNLSWKKSGGS